MGMLTLSRFSHILPVPLTELNLRYFHCLVIHSMIINEKHVIMGKR